MTTVIDFDKRYRVDAWPGIAFWLKGWIADADGLVETHDFVRAVMVGDNKEHIIDVDDLTPINDNDYCSCCGQIGCGWGGN